MKIVRYSYHTKFQCMVWKSMQTSHIQMRKFTPLLRACYFPFRPVSKGEWYEFSTRENFNGKSRAVPTGRCTGKNKMFSRGKARAENAKQALASVYELYLPISSRALQISWEVVSLSEFSHPSVGMVAPAYPLYHLGTQDVVFELFRGRIVCDVRFALFLYPFFRCDVFRLGILCSI